ncbi:MAG: hypothetical protein ABSH48_10010 [Verrucomicrobiota bacterium]
MTKFEAAAGWGDTLVAVVGRQIRRLNFSVLWQRKVRLRVFSRPRSVQRIARAGIDFTGRREHFI